MQECMAAICGASMSATGCSGWMRAWVVDTSMMGVVKFYIQVDHIYTYIDTDIYIYIYIERERERKIVAGLG
jgi:hypothetical protein